jgi:hypothetical protein
MKLIVTVLLFLISVAVGEKYSHLHGTGKVIITFPSEKEVIVDEQTISVLLNPEVSDRKIVIFSIVGAFRKGKSFLLNYALRFLYGNVSY